MKTIEHARLFEKLEPPAHGRERFEKKFAHSGQSRLAGLAAAGLSAALLVLAVILFFERPAPLPESEFASNPALARLLGEDIRPDPTVTVRINKASITVNRQQGTNPDVRIYAIRRNMPEGDAKS